MAHNLRLAEPRQRNLSGPSLVSESTNLPVAFDLDAYHAMSVRDDQLVAQRAAHGVAGKIFIYKFSMKGQQVEGISVEGAQQLAGTYGGIKHRMVASVEKKGSVFTFRSYPSQGVPMAVNVAVVPELAGEDDFYSVLVECTDVKTGNSFQVEKSENRFEERKDGSPYQRPNYQIIAQSKARRNAILALIPGDAQENFKKHCLETNEAIDITSDVFRMKLAGVTQYAAKRGIAIDRRALQDLTLEQISGLGEAARGEDTEGFQEAMEALGLVTAQEIQQNDDDEHAGRQGGGGAQQQSDHKKRSGRPIGSRNKTAQAADVAVTPAGDDYNPETGEVREETSQPGRPTAPAPVFEE